MRASLIYRILRFAGHAVWGLHRILDWPSRRLARVSIALLTRAETLRGSRNASLGRSTMRGG